MARISIRDLPDDLHMQLMRSAAGSQRSLEGEIRYGLMRYVQSITESRRPPTPLRETWQRETGQRLSRLLQRLRDDDAYAWNERLDLPSLAMSLGESSPAMLMDYIDGHAALTFDMATRLAEKFSCSLQWLISGTGSMFPYPEIGGSYREFFAPALEDKSNIIKLVRICSNKGEDDLRGRHDGTLLMFCIKDGHPTISAGYSGRFYLNGNMGSSGHASFEGFVEFLNENKNICYSDYNYTGTVDDTGLWEHHPNFYLKNSSRAHWLMPMLEGRSPGTISWQT